MKRRDEPDDQEPGELDRARAVDQKRQREHDDEREAEHEPGPREQHDRGTADDRPGDRLTSLQRQADARTLQLPAGTRTKRKLGAIGELLERQPSPNEVLPQRDDEPALFPRHRPEPLRNCNARIRSRARLNRRRGRHRAPSPPTEAAKPARHVRAPWRRSMSNSKRTAVSPIRSTRRVSPSRTVASSVTVERR